MINHIYVVNAQSYDIGDGYGYYGEFFWDGGPGPTGRVAITDSYRNYGCCQANFNDQRIGWFITCAWSSCEDVALLQVGELQLTATENQGPSIAAVPANNLWYQGGKWVRGTWPISFWASDPSGVCSTNAILGSQMLSGPGGIPNQDAWHQCPNQAWSQQVDTSASKGSMGLGEGSMPLVLLATNAAGVTSWPAQTVYADNQAPTVSMSGPIDAPASVGTQFITATAAAGPSGVAGISCSLDGAPYQWHPGARAELPVAGVGTHSATCVAANNAHDASGNLGTSAPASWRLTIRQPTVLGISFFRLADALHCKRARERVTVPARWITIRRHHKLIHVHRHARTKVVKVIRCRPRTVTRRLTVWATTTRHGKKVRVKRTKVVRVLVLPHLVGYTTRRVAYAHGTTVSGWLGTSSLTAVAGQPVEVLTAADNGRRNFRKTALVTTGADGFWTARLPPGPSRLVEAFYPGAATTEPALSNQVQVVVPAKVLLHIRPLRTRWGGTIQIWGRVLGGYVPGARQQLLRLRIGVDGIHSTVGIPDIQRNGRFRTTWTFNSGTGVVTYWFTVSTLNEADYAYAPASSARLYVTVGPR